MQDKTRGQVLQDREKWRRETWADIKKNSPELAELITGLKEAFGPLTLESYERKENDA